MLGLFEGKIELKLDKLEFCPGETIQGTIQLTLKKPLKARGVFAKFWGENEVRSTSAGKTTTTTQKYSEIEKNLDGEKEYSTPSGPLAYNFSIVIPDNVYPKLDLGDNMAGKIVNFLQDAGYQNMRWYVGANLDLPLAFDISKKIQIQVIRPK